MPERSRPDHLLVLVEGSVVIATGRCAAVIPTSSVSIGSSGKLGGGASWVSVAAGLGVANVVACVGAGTGAAAGIGVAVAAGVGDGVGIGVDVSVGVDVAAIGVGVAGTGIGAGVGVAETGVDVARTGVGVGVAGGGVVSATVDNAMSRSGLEVVH
jgi:hypothetical protein